GASTYCSPSRKRREPIRVSASEATTGRPVVVAPACASAAGARNVMIATAAVTMIRLKSGGRRGSLSSARSYAPFFESASAISFPPASQCIHHVRIDLSTLALGSVSVLFNLVWPQCVAPRLAFAIHVRICEEMYGQRPQAARGVLGVRRQPHRR